MDGLDRAASESRTMTQMNSSESFEQAAAVMAAAGEVARLGEMVVLVVCHLPVVRSPCHCLSIITRWYRTLDISMHWEMTSSTNSRVKVTAGTAGTAEMLATMGILEDCRRLHTLAAGGPCARKLPPRLPQPPDPIQRP